jgi:4-azaleucine resistance transporter AzlC
MLDRYRGTGKLKPYLIYGLIDETFSILGMGHVPEGVDRRWYYFFVSLFNESYWVLSTAAGACFSDGLPFDTRGIEFVLPALFLAIFMNSWQQERQHISSIGGLVITFCCLMAFGTRYFLLASMACIVFLLLIFRRKLSVFVPVQEGDEK